MIIRTISGAAMLAATLAGTAVAQGAVSKDVPRTDYLTTMDQEFGKMDADKNGKVTRAEVEAFDRAVVIGNARARALATFAQLDSDHNGQISPTEFMKLVTGAPPVDGAARSR